MAERRSGRLLALSLVLLLLGACLLLCARRLALSGGDTTVTELAGGELWLPARGQTGEIPAVLVTRSFGDGAEALACELTRRGTAVLLLPEDIPLQTGWEALCGADFARISSLGLLVRGAQIPPAAEYAQSLAGSGMEPGAVIALGTPSELAALEATEARNVLFLSGRQPAEAVLSGFYGNTTPIGRISGYFGEGNARAVHLLSGAAFPRYSRRDAVEKILDWLGSSLGHSVELPDGELIIGQLTAFRIGGGVCLALALTGAGFVCKRRFHEK